MYNTRNKKLTWVMHDPPKIIIHGEHPDDPMALWPSTGLLGLSRPGSGQFCKSSIVYLKFGYMIFLFFSLICLSVNSKLLSNIRNL